MNNWELGNNMGFQCPNCTSGAHLYINATVQVVAELVPDGTDNDDCGGTEWDDDSVVRCYASKCFWSGRVKDLINVPEEDFDPDGEYPKEKP